VTQIKILHRTKCNFSTTVWDFYTQISWYIWERSCYNNPSRIENIDELKKVLQ